MLCVCILAAFIHICWIAVYVKSLSASKCYTWFLVWENQSVSLGFSAVEKAEWQDIWTIMKEGNGESD